MFKNIIKYCLSLSALSCVIPAFAHSEYFYDSSQYTEISQAEIAKQEKEAELRFARTGHDYYVYGGYLYSYHFNDKNAVTSSETTVGNFGITATVTLSPQAALSDTFNGLEIGFGKQWSRHLDFQIAYIQEFEKIKHGTGTVIAGSSAASSLTTAKISMKGIGINFLYLLNPDDRFQVGAKLGLRIEHYNETVIATTTPITPPNIPPTNTYELPGHNTAEIDPAGGLEFVYSITPELAVRLNGVYVWHTQSKISSGEVNAFVGLSYIL